jgi:hypothetical protein
MAQFNDTIYKVVGEPETETEYTFRKLSTNQTNIITAVFNEEFYIDAKTAYDPGRTSSFKTTYLSQTSTSLVKQADSTGKICAVGELLRFIPGDYKQTAHIKVISGTFNPKNGVIFNNGRGIDGASITGGEMNVFAYGSSIKKVRYMTSVQKITAYFDPQSECTHYTYPNCTTAKTNPQAYYYDYGSFILGNPVRVRTGNLKSYSYNLQSLPITNYGKIISVIISEGTVTILVEMNSIMSEDVITNPDEGFDYSKAGNEVYIEEIQDYPCARYRIDRVESLVASNIIQEIEFADTASFTYNPTFPGQAAYKVIQYNHSTSEIKTGEEYLSRIEGNVLGWSGRKLYVQCLSGVFDKHNGKVIQLDSTGNISAEGLGGNGYDLEYSDFNKKSGFFINISEKYAAPTKGDFTVGNNIVQQITASTNWFKEQNYTVNSTIRQYFSEAEFAEGQVLKWYMPKTFAQSTVRPPTLIFRWTSPNTKFDFTSSGPSKLLPDSLDYYTADNWSYTTETSFITTKDLPSIYNEQQLVGSKNEFFGLLESGGSDTYAVGPRVVPQGALLGNCFITAIDEPDSSTVFKDRKLSKIPIYGITPDPIFTSKEIFDYFGSLSFNAKELFVRDNVSVKYNKIKFKSLSTELKENDILIDNATGIKTNIISLYTLIESDGTEKTVVITKRDELTNTFINDAFVSKITRSGIPITLNQTLQIETIEPYSTVYMFDRSNTGLIYPLQKAKYFETVKESSPNVKIEVIKSFYGDSLSAGNIVISGTSIGQTTLKNGKLIYKTNDTTPVIKTIDIGAGAQNSSTKEISISRPSDINSTDTGYIFTGIFDCNITTNYRKKNLEPQIEIRNIRYNDIIDEYYSYLTKADVYQIDRITTGTGATLKDITKYFSLDTGETDDIYGFAKLRIKKDLMQDLLTALGYASAENLVDLGLDLTITYQYFKHEEPGNGIIGPIIRESYQYGDKSQMELKDMGYFAAQDGQVYHKSSLVDFRPITVTKQTVPQNADPYDSKDYYDIDFILSPHTTFTITNGYYLSRIDKLYLNKDGNFVVDKGVPSLSPSEPATNTNLGMLLYTITVPGYTENLKDIYYSKIENKRYTMRDIGKLDKRISDIEYYTTLSLLEKEATDMVVKDANGLTREKNGIIVDSFVSHAVGDIYSREYNACVNQVEGYLRPPFKTTRLDLVQTSTPSNFIKINSSIVNTAFGSTGTSVSTGLYLLNPEKSERFIVQPLATQTILITALDSARCDGQIILEPSIDDWVDIDQKPAVRVDLNGDNEAWEILNQALFNNNIAPFGTFYGEWNTTEQTEFKPGKKKRTVGNLGHVRGGSGGARDDVFEEVDVTKKQERSVTQRSLQGTDRDVNLGDRITDISISHYIRPQTIKVYATGLRPNTKFYVFFDDIDIKEYCSYNRNGTFIKLTDSLYVPKTDSKGNVELTFDLPQGKFRTGDKTFVITDSSTNDKNDKSTTMYANATFSASGLSMTKESTETTIRDYKLISTEVKENRTITEIDLNYLYSISWDPLAQTFTVNEQLYPNGVYIESLDLCFATKDPNIPVKVEIRPTINGYPDSNRIYPNAVSILTPSLVKALNDGDGIPDIDNSQKYTRFTFDAPVYLAPGEHSFVVKSDSKLYTLYCAQIGKTDLKNPNIRVLSNPYTGVIFRSANASTWEPDGTTDLMFSMQKLVFDSTASESNPKTKEIEFYAEALTAKDFNNTFEKTSNLLTFETFNLPIKFIDYPTAKTQINISYVDADGTAIIMNNVPAKTDVMLSVPGKLQTIGSSNRFKITLRTILTNPHVSPVLDIQQSGAIFVRNMIDTSEIANNSIDSTILNNELKPFPDIKTGTVNGTNPATVRYMTRKVTLTPGFDATNIKLLLTMYKPGGTSVAAYIKTEGITSNGRFAEQSYRELTLDTPNFNSIEQDDYREMQFSLPDDIEPFDKFSIKICLFSNNSCVVPKVKDMRAIAVQ